MFEYPEMPRFPSKPGPTLKALLIHDDYAIYLWFDGKWFAKLIYDILVIGIEMKHLSVWKLYTFERFSSIWMNQVFSLMFFRKKMQIDLNLIFVLWISSLCLNFSLLRFEKFCSDQFRDWLFIKHVHSFWSIFILYLYNYYL